MGTPPLDGKERAEVRKALDDANSYDEFDKIARYYYLLREKAVIGDSPLATVLNLVGSYLFKFGYQYDRSVLTNPKGQKVSFQIGALESQTGIFTEILPTVLGLAHWDERVEIWDSSDFYTSLGNDDSEAGDLAVLTKVKTNICASALDADIDFHMDCDSCSWTVTEIWTIEIMGQSKFLRMIGERTLRKEQSILAFGYLRDSMLTRKLDFKTGQHGIFDRAKDAYIDASDFARKIGFAHK